MENFHRDNEERKKDKEKKNFNGKHSKFINIVGRVTTEPLSSMYALPLTLERLREMLYLAHLLRRSLLCPSRFPTNNNQSAKFLACGCGGGGHHSDDLKESLALCWEGSRQNNQKAHITCLLFIFMIFKGTLSPNSNLFNIVSPKLLTVSVISNFRKV